MRAILMPDRHGSNNVDGLKPFALCMSAARRTTERSEPKRKWPAVVGDSHTARKRAIARDVKMLVLPPKRASQDSSPALPLLVNHDILGDPAVPRPRR
jgi:hypothetical protein